RVAERNEPDQLHRRRRPGGDRQYPETLSLKLFRRRCRGRRWLGLADDHGEGTLEYALRATARLRNRRLGHLRRRIERHELDHRGASVICLPPAAERMAAS